MRRILVSNTIAGILIGYFLFHPFAHVVDNLFTYKSFNGQTHTILKTVFIWIIESYSVTMFPMSLIYLVVFGLFGLIIGKQKIILKSQSIRIKEEQKKREEVKKLYEEFLRNELKNMIAPINGYSEILLLYRNENLTDEQYKYLTSINDNTKKMVNLIDSLKHLQNFETKTYKLKKVDYEITKIIIKVMGDLEAYGKENGVFIECINNLKNPEVNIDVHLIYQVFNVLLKNAIEHISYSDNGSDKKIKIELYNRKNKVFVKINNKGEIVPPHRIELFFEKFNVDRKKKKNGFGLGTTYAYLVTSAHGGNTYVESNTRSGTTVMVELNNTS